MPRLPALLAALILATPALAEDPPIAGTDWPEASIWNSACTA